MYPQNPIRLLENMRFDPVNIAFRVVFVKNCDLDAFDRMKRA
jgi:hypothetical protein